MKAPTSCIILAGGLGTRLRSVLPDLPKPMAPVNGRPFLEYLLAQVRAAGVEEVLLSVGYKADVIESYFGDGSRFGVQVRYSVEREPLGTGGALALAAREIRTDPFLAMNGDSFCETDFRALAECHQAHGAAATLVAKRVEDRSRYGGLRLGPEGQVLGFEEKGGEAGPGWINGGIYLLNRAVLEAVPLGSRCSIERDVFPALAGRGLYAARMEGRFIDIGVPEELERAQAFLRDRVGGLAP